MYNGGNTAQEDVKWYDEGMKRLPCHVNKWSGGGRGELFWTKGIIVLVRFICGRVW